MRNPRLKILVTMKTSILVVTAFLLLGCSEDPSGPSLSRGFSLPLSLNSPMTWDGSHLWFVSGGHCYRVSTRGEIVSSFDPPGDDCGGIEWDGSHLWTHDGSTVYTHYGTGDVFTIYQVTTSGEIISSFRSPVGYPKEIVSDGTCLWIYGGEPTGLADWYKVSTSGEILDSMQPSLGNHGAAWDGHHLWCVVHPSRISGRRYSHLFRMSASGEVVESHKFDDVQFWGLAFDGADFWVISCVHGTDCRVCKTRDL